MGFHTFAIVLCTLLCFQNVVNAKQQVQLEKYEAHNITYCLHEVAPDLTELVKTTKEQIVIAANELGEAFWNYYQGLLEMADAAFYEILELVEKLDLCTDLQCFVNAGRDILEKMQEIKIKASQLLGAFQVEMKQFFVSMKETVIVSRDEFLRIKEIFVNCLNEV